MNLKFLLHLPKRGYRGSMSAAKASRTIKYFRQMEKQIEREYKIGEISHSVYLALSRDVKSFFIERSDVMLQCPVCGKQYGRSSLNNYLDDPLQLIKGERCFDCNKAFVEKLVVEKVNLINGVNGDARIVSVVIDGKTISVEKNGLFKI